MDVERRVRELGGAVARGALGNSRALRRETARLVAEGRLVLHAAGCLALPAADPDIVRARQFRALLTCVSAARAYGFSLLSGPDSTHLAIPHRRGASRHPEMRGARVVVHREAPALLTCVPHPVVGAGGPFVVAPAEALARLLRCQDSVSAIVATDSALNRRACTTPDIAALLTGPGSPAAKAVLAECDGSSMSPAETVARVALRRAGFGVEANGHIAGVGYVDLLVEGRVVVECDGFAYHSSQRAFEADRARDRTLQMQGFAVLRFPAEAVLTDPAGVVAAVRALLGRW